MQFLQQEGEKLNKDLFPMTYVTCLEDVVCVLHEYAKNVRDLIDENAMLREINRDYNKLLFGEEENI